jgi:hypothetical protein
MATVKVLDEFLKILQGAFEPWQYSPAFVDFSDEIRYLRFRNSRNPSSKIRLLTTSNARTDSNRWLEIRMS